MLTQLSSLEFGHSHGIIHCNVKPENTLLSLTEENTLHLIDFSNSCCYRELGDIPQDPDPLANLANVTGTMCWESINSHRGRGEQTPSPR